MSFQKSALPWNLLFFVNHAETATMGYSPRSYISYLFSENSKKRRTLKVL